MKVAGEVVHEKCLRRQGLARGGNPHHPEHRGERVWSAVGTECLRIRQPRLDGRDALIGQGCQNGRVSVNREVGSNRYRVKGEGCRVKGLGRSGLPLDPRPFTRDQSAEEVSDDGADGLRDARGLRLAAGDPLGVELPQAPAGLGRPTQPLDEVGKLRRAVEEVECLLELLLGGCAAVQVVVDGDDGRRARGIELALLLAGEPDEVQRVDVGARDRLLGGEEGGERNAKRFSSL